MIYNRFLLVIFPVYWCFLVSEELCCQTVQIPQCQFQMGSMSGEPDEQPVHDVHLSAYSINNYEITNQQYDSCVNAGRCTAAHYNDSQCIIWDGRDFKKYSLSNPVPLKPVVCITWNQAQMYCKSKGMKLPSEAQWENAAKAGSTSDYWWGKTAPSKERCAFALTAGPQDVGHFVSNKWQLSDMTGNVWEWTADFYEQEYYQYSELKDPTGPSTGLYKVIRGGGWYSSAAQLRVTNRHWFSPDTPEASIGFRCVK